MWKIEVSDETVDSLFRDILVEDYHRLRSDIYELSNRENLPQFEHEDLENNKRYFEAIKVLMEYYLPYDKAQAIIGEA